MRSLRGTEDLRALFASTHWQGFSTCGPGPPLAKCCFLAGARDPRAVRAALLHPGGGGRWDVLGGFVSGGTVSVRSGAIITFETWLFMWAPRNGYGLDSSLGFLLLPICLVLGGRFILRSAISPMQWAVVAMAGLAVTVKITATPQLGWVTLAVCLPFTAYFVGRTYWRLDNLAAFGVEMTLASPLALYFLWDRPGWEGELGLLIAVGIGSVIAMSAYVGASSMLPIPLFGLLSYVEPMLLVVAAIS